MIIRQGTWEISAMRWRHLKAWYDYRGRCREARFYRPSPGDNYSISHGRRRHERDAFRHEPLLRERQRRGRCKYWAYIGRFCTAFWLWRVILKEASLAKSISRDMSARHQLRFSMATSSEFIYRIAATILEYFIYLGSIYGASFSTFALFAFIACSSAWLIS